MCCNAPCDPGGVLWHVLCSTLFCGTSHYHAAMQVAAALLGSIGAKSPHVRAKLASHMDALVQGDHGLRLLSEHGPLHLRPLPHCFILIDNWIHPAGSAGTFPSMQIRQPPALLCH